MCGTLKRVMWYFEKVAWYFEECVYSSPKSPALFFSRIYIIFVLLIFNYRVFSLRLLYVVTPKFIFSPRLIDVLLFMLLIFMRNRIWLLGKFFLMYALYASFCLHQKTKI